jgi:hypothetical protein
MARKQKSSEDSEYLNNRIFSTPQTEESRENQMIELAMDVTEWRLRHNQASSQEIVHFLKLGCLRAKLETEMLQTQKELVQAKTSAIKEAKSMNELYSQAMDALHIYRGEADDSYYGID